MSDNILRIRNVRKNFGGIAALNGINMDVERGKMTMLIGPNGSGKTTLINVVSGFYKPDEGKILLYNKDITGQPPNKVSKEGLARTFQIPAPFKKLSVMENLLIADDSNPGESFLKAPFKRVWQKKEAEIFEHAWKVLDLINLELPDQFASDLSGGQLKLLEVGRALMTGARVVILDEPASGLNPTLAHQVFEHLEDIKEKSNVTFLIIEHRLDITLQYVDYVYALAQGAVVSHGDPEKVLSDQRVIDGYLGASCS